MGKWFGTFSTRTRVEFSLIFSNFIAVEFSPWKLETKIYCSVLNYISFGMSVVRFIL